MKPDKLTVKEVSELTGKSEKTVYRYIKAGKLTATKVRGRYGRFYIMSAEEVIDSGLNFIKKIPFSEVVAERESISGAPNLPAMIEPEGDGVVTELLRKENFALMQRNETLENEIRKAAYILGVLRCRYAGARRKLFGAERSKEDLDLKLLKRTNERDFYREKLEKEESISIFRRLFGLVKFTRISHL